MAAKNTKMINDMFGRKSILTHDPDTFWPLPSELIGLEIEVESLRHHSFSSPLWTTHSDGSLRDGTEFVLSSPLGGATLRDAVNQFFDAGLSYTISPRTSIHVHINASDNMTVDQFRNMFVLMYLIEPAVFRWADENRKWCGYCSPLTDLAPQRIINILNDDRDGVKFVMAVRGESNSDRYYGYNVAAYQRHGTVEFRYFPCTTDRQQVIDWIKFCMYVKKAGRSHENPEAILALLQNRQGLTNFLNEWFGDVAAHIIRNLDFDDCLDRVRDMGTMVNVSPDSMRSPDGFYRMIRSRGFNRYVAKTFPTLAVPSATDNSNSTAASELAGYLQPVPNVRATLRAMEEAAARVVEQPDARRPLEVSIGDHLLRLRQHMEACRNTYVNNPSQNNRRRYHMARDAFNAAHAASQSTGI